MSYEETKYTVGDTFIRDYNGVECLCILTSRDKVFDRYVWQSVMFMMFDNSLGGGKSIEYYEEDLDGLFRVGSISVRKEANLWTVSLAPADGVTF